MDTVSHIMPKLQLTLNITLYFHLFSKPKVDNPVKEGTQKETMQRESEAHQHLLHEYYIKIKL